MTTTDTRDATERLEDRAPIDDTSAANITAETADLVVEDSEPAPHRDSQGARPADYVVPIVHTHVPEYIVDAACWASLGAVALVGALDLPAAGLLAAGLFVVRYRHQH